MSNSILTLSDNIDDIEIDSINVFRIGTVNGGFLKIVDTVWTLYTILNGSGIPDNSQKGVTVDNNGLEWLATPANGLVAHPGGFTWLIYNQFTSTMPSSSATCLVALPNPDRIWVGTYDFGIVRKTGVTFDFFDKTNSPMPDSSIQCIEKDRDGIIWIGTQAAGLVRLDESQLTFINELSIVTPQPVIFPVPVKNQLTVYYPYQKFTEIDLSDVTGKYLNITFNKPAADFYTTDLGSLTAGVYFLQMTTSDGKMLTKKIIKTN
jgi:ligand-binding sensor domain-containing protein